MRKSRKKYEPSKKLVIYSKFCFECVYQTECQRISSWANTNGVKATILRTSYNPIHHEAAKAYRTEYTAFGVLDGKDYDLDEIPNLELTDRGWEMKSEHFTNCKNKKEESALFGKEEE